jgi:hypothetical protein
MESCGLLPGFFLKTLYLSLSALFVAPSHKRVDLGFDLLTRGDVSAEWRSYRTVYYLPLLTRLHDVREAAGKFWGGASFLGLRVEPQRPAPSAPGRTTRRPHRYSRKTILMVLLVGRPLVLRPLCCGDRRPKARVLLYEFFEGPRQGVGHRDLAGVGA